MPDNPLSVRVAQALIDSNWQLQNALNSSMYIIPGYKEQIETNERLIAEYLADKT